MYLPPIKNNGSEKTTVQLFEVVEDNQSNRHMKIKTHSEPLSCTSQTQTTPLKFPSNLEINKLEIPKKNFAGLSSDDDKNTCEGGITNMQSNHISDYVQIRKYLTFDFYHNC